MINLAFVLLYIIEDKVFCNNKISFLYYIVGDNMKFIKELYEDAKNIKEKDPASRNILEVIILYPRFSHISIP